MLNTFKSPRHEENCGAPSSAMEKSPEINARKRKRSMEEVFDALPRPKITASVHRMPSQFRSTVKSLAQSQKRSDTSRIAATQHRSLVSRPHVAKPLPAIRFSALPQPRSSGRRSSSSGRAWARDSVRRPESPKWWTEISSIQEAKLDTEGKQAEAKTLLENAGVDSEGIDMMEEHRCNRHQARRASWRPEEWLVAKALADASKKKHNGDEAFGFDRHAS